MNTFDLKYFHIMMVIIFTYNVVVSVYNPSKKISKILLGINTLVLIGSGFALLKKFGIPHAGPYPLWIWTKFGCWLLLAILPPIMIKRLPNVTQKIHYLFLALILIAAFMGVYKPQ